MQPPLTSWVISVGECSGSHTLFNAAERHSTLALLKKNDIRHHHSHITRENLLEGDSRADRPKLTAPRFSCALPDTRRAFAATPGRCGSQPRTPYVRPRHSEGVFRNTRPTAPRRVAQRT